MRNWLNMLSIGMSSHGVSSLSNVQRTGCLYAGQATADGMLRAGLDALCASLVGFIPLRERIWIREETGFHPDRLLNACILEGMPSVQVARHATDKYGSATEVAQEFLDSWYQYHPSGKRARRVGLGIVTA